MRHFEGAKLNPKARKVMAETFNKKTNGDFENGSTQTPQGGVGVERNECFQKQAKQKQN